MTLQSELKSEGKDVSIRTLCSILGIPRSTMYYKPVMNRKAIPEDGERQMEIYAIIQQYPAYALRRVRVELRRRGGKWPNRKKIHRIIKRNHWQNGNHIQGRHARARVVEQQAVRSRAHIQGSVFAKGC